MDIACFDDLLRAARAQPEPQRLLLVFATASLPADASAAQREGFEAGVGGELAPALCVDKDPRALADFAALVAEAQQFATPWHLVFAAALGGRGGQAPSDAQVDAALQSMVDALRGGRVDGFVPFDRHGDAVRLG